MQIHPLFILESIGTQELILVGLVALIIFGPRKLPQMARKFGNMLTELRKVSNDFKQTWEREASLDEDTFARKQQSVPAIGPPPTVSNLPSTEESEELRSEETEAAPEIREVSPEEFERSSRPALEDSAASMDPDPPAEEPVDDPSDKRNWL